MVITVKRLYKTENSTIGELLIDGVFECFTLEDKERPVKIKGETAGWRAATLGAMLFRRVPAAAELAKVVQHITQRGRTLAVRKIQAASHSIAHRKSVVSSTTIKKFISRANKPQPIPRLTDWMFFTQRTYKEPQKAKPL